MEDDDGTAPALPSFSPPRLSRISSWRRSTLQTLGGSPGNRKSIGAAKVGKDKAFFNRSLDSAASSKHGFALVDSVRSSGQRNRRATITSPTGSTFEKKLVPRNTAPGGRWTSLPLSKTGLCKVTVAFLQEHPFFKIASPEFRERLAPRLVRRCEDTVVDGQVHLTTQGNRPEESSDYLFISNPGTKLEVSYDGKIISRVHDATIVGHEVIFNLCQTFLFTVSKQSGPQLWVVPKNSMLTLLDQFEEDAELLKQKAEQEIVQLLQTWYARPQTSPRFRLFENAENPFNMDIIKLMSLQVHRAGSAIRAYNDKEESCFCLFRGEADVFVDRQLVTSLSHAPDASSWQAWWGVLETTGVCDSSPSDVVAKTDSLTWTLPRRALETLKRTYPRECHLFVKVGIMHLTLLRDYAPEVHKAPIFGGVDLVFLSMLAGLVQRRVCEPDEVLIAEGQPGTEIFFIARGVTEGRKAWGGKKLQRESAQEIISSSTMVLQLKAGAFFGEQATLGFRPFHTLSVLSTTCCDLRVLEGAQVMELLTRHPDGGEAFAMMAAAQGHSDTSKAMKEPLSSLSIFGNIDMDFLSKLHSEMQSRVFFTGAVMFKQGQPITSLIVLVDGSVDIEVDGAETFTVAAPAVLCMCQLNRETMEDDQMEKHWCTARSPGVAVLRICKAERLMALLREADRQSQAQLERLPEQWIRSATHAITEKGLTYKRRNNIAAEVAQSQIWPPSQISPSVKGTPIDSLPVGAGVEKPVFILPTLEPPAQHPCEKEADYFVEGNSPALSGRGKTQSLPSPRRHQQWALRRAKAIADSQAIREARLVQANAITPLLPATCGFLLDDNTRPSRRATLHRLMKVKNIYGPPIWAAGAALSSR